MTMKDLEKRIVALEAQVAMLSGQLAARQQPIVIPAPSYPPYPGWRQQPWTITSDTLSATTTAPRARVSLRVIEGKAS